MKIRSSIQALDKRLPLYLRVITLNTRYNYISVFKACGYEPARLRDIESVTYTLLFSEDKKIEEGLMAKRAMPDKNLKPLFERIFSIGDAPKPKEAEGGRNPTASFWEEAIDLIPLAAAGKLPLTYRDNLIASEMDKDLISTFAKALKLSYVYNADYRTIFKGWQAYQYTKKTTTINENGSKNEVTLYILNKMKECLSRNLAKLEADKWYTASSFIRLLRAEPVQLSYLMAAEINTIAKESSMTKDSAAVFYIDSVYRYILYEAALFGILDIIEEKQNEKRPESPYATLSCIRLSPIGEYLTGKRDKLPEVPDTPVVPDPEFLFLTYTGKKSATRLILSSIGRKFGENRYIIEKGLGAGINRGNLDNLRALLGDDIPDNWKAFFYEEEKKTESAFRVESRGMIIRVLSEDVMKKIMRDADCRTLVSAVDSSRLYIPDFSKTAFSKRLRALGINGENIR